VMEYNENLSLFHLADRTDLSYLVNLFTHRYAQLNYKGDSGHFPNS
uniref:Uncharacterized protein n=1 Tax=Plectus sambesii TaxID=2011161 RepID=A0A914VRH2_9BILA